jgi:transposase-like protein
MRGKKVSAEIKAGIIAESLRPGCVIANLAKETGISMNTIYSWRSKYNSLSLANSGSLGKADSFDSAGNFIELSVSQPRQLLNLQEVSLRFDDLSLVMQGQIKSSVLLAIVKILEEVC